MYKAKINSVEKVRHQARNVEFLDVSFDIVDNDDKVVVSKRIGLDPTATKQQVIDEVNGHVVEYGREVENAKVDAEREKANANVKDMQNNLVGQTVEPDTSEAEKPSEETGSDEADK